MKRQNRFLALMTAICVFNVFSLCRASEASSVTIKGKALSEISDVVATATGSKFPEIRKHSLLYVERVPDGDKNSFIGPRIFTISSDGSRVEEYILGGITNSGQMAVSHKETIAKMMKVAVSGPSGTKNTAAYFVAGDEINNIDIGHSSQLIDFKDGKIDSQINAGTYLNEKIIWGLDTMTFRSAPDKEYFVSAVTNEMAFTGAVKVGLFEKNNSGHIVSDNDAWYGDVLTFKNGIRGVGIATGDFDGDGYQNDLAVCLNDDTDVRLHVYTFTRKGAKDFSFEEKFNFLIHTGPRAYTSAFDRQACVNVMTGDFDGDGKTEIATVNRVFPGDSDNNRLRIMIFKYDENSKNWKEGHEDLGGTQGPCKATRADLDGDGKDEIALLRFIYKSGTGGYWGQLERWYCDYNTIKPKQDKTNYLGGIDSNAILGGVLGGAYLNTYYYVGETISITAGPLTGQRGGAKLADDVAISWTDMNRRVYVFPTKLNERRQFEGFEARKTIFDQPVGGSGKYARGAVITADFCDEGLRLGNPVHTVDDTDMSYIVAIQAMPYHVDNVPQTGDALLPNPINYSFSGFLGDEGNGQMSVTYSKKVSTSDDNNVSTNMASTTETIGVLGPAGPYVQGYLQFQATAANIAGNFDKRIAAAADAANAVMELVTDKIDKTTDESTKTAYSSSITEDITALDLDRLYTYDAKQHIWRYEILNNPLPKWFVEGQRTGMDNNKATPNSPHYLTFTMYDTPKPLVSTSLTLSAYQPRHEEGNLFSYPTTVEAGEGYNINGALMDSPYAIAWSKSPSSKRLEFTKAKTVKKDSDEEVTPSALTKAISAITTLLSVDSPVSLPPYTTHNETFSQTHSTTDAIDMKFQGRSTLPASEIAGHTLYMMPYVAREGTLTLGTAVQIDTDLSQTLWSSSLYAKYPDPALVLPSKFWRNGASFAAQTNDIAAMKIRGMRFSVPELGILNSDSKLLAGLTYHISLPIYNASFVDTGSFDVKLSYVKRVDQRNPMYSEGLQEIGRDTLSLGKWNNTISNNNKGWAEFDWKVPDVAESGQYYFLIQIDPDVNLREVHDARLSADGTIQDVGGNNDGYFPFDIISAKDAENIIAKRSAPASVKASSEKKTSPIAYFSAYRESSGEIQNTNVRPSYYMIDPTSSLFVHITLMVPGFENGTESLQDVYDYLKAQSDDSIVPIGCKITYESEWNEEFEGRVFPEVLFYGHNLKPGAYDEIGRNASKLTEENIDNAFMRYEISLFPDEDVYLTFYVRPSDVDWVNGAAFVLYIPELDDDETSEDTEHENEEGEDVSDTDNWGEYIEDEYEYIDDDDEQSGTNIPRSSGGGCAMGFSVLTLIMLSGLALKIRKVK